MAEWEQTRASFWRSAQRQPLERADVRAGTFAGTDVEGVAAERSAGPLFE